MKQKNVLKSETEPDLDRIFSSLKIKIYDCGDI